MQSLLVYTVNFVEAFEFIRAVKAFRSKYSEVLPALQLYDAEKEGYCVYIKIGSFHGNFLDYLKMVVKTRGLQLRRGKAFLIVSSF